MVVHVNAHIEITEQEIEARYNRAQALLQGLWATSVATNTTVIPHWIGRNDFFWYEREFKEGKEFRLVDAERGANEIAFDHADLASAITATTGQAVNENDLPINEIEINLERSNVTFSAFGRRWLFDGGEKTCVEVERISRNQLISPDGKKSVFIRGDNLWIRELTTGKERALTQDGEPYYSYASAPSAYGMKLTQEGVEALWSPDSQRIFTVQLDTRLVKTLPKICHVPQGDSPRPTVSHTKRSNPGDDSVDEYRFLSIEVESGLQQDADYYRCPVFRNAMGFFTYRNGWWGNDCRHAYFLDLPRGDREARLVKFDTHTGKTLVVIKEASPDTCFKLRLDSRDPILIMPLPDSDEVIWYSERSGYAHLYLYDYSTGQFKTTITEGSWLVRDILDYDPERRELLIQTAGRVAGRHEYYRDICRVQIDSGKFVDIRSSDHEYFVFDADSEIAINLGSTRDIRGASGVSPSGKYIVATRSRADEVPVSLLLDKAGNELLEIEIADVSGLPDGWVWPEPVKLKAADEETDIYAVVFRPSNFSPEISYPILDFSWNLKEGNTLVAGSFTNNAQAGYMYLGAAAYAELGFVVVSIYGRGTSARHRTFSADPHPELPHSNNQADRVAGIRQLAERYPYMDINRVGAGGFVSNTAAISGLLGYPDFYKVGVSDNAVMDLRLAPAFWGEAYGEPSSMEDDCQQPYELASDFSGKLLLMNGMLDSQVCATFRLIEALKEANKDFDMLFLPNDGHTMCSYATRRAWDYLVKHLLGVEPPSAFKLVTSFDLIMQKFTEQQEISKSLAEKD